MLKLAIEVTAGDFVLWWKNERNSNTTKPLLHYLFGAKDFLNNFIKLLPKLYSNCVLNKETDDLRIRQLLAVGAMYTAYLDHTNKENFIFRGCKLTLARRIAETLLSSSKDVIHHQLETLLPNWFSFLVGVELIERRSNTRISEQKDLFSAMVSLSNESSAPSHTLLVFYKYFSFSTLHLAIRSNQHFTNSSEEPFNVFCAMKALVSKSKIKSVSKAIQLKNLIKISVETQRNDLQTMQKIVTNDYPLTSEEMKFLLFVMNYPEDYNWLPS